MTTDEANGENEPRHEPKLGGSFHCPLCGMWKYWTHRCCSDCRSVLQAVSITEQQALRDARIIKNWRQN